MYRILVSDDLDQPGLDVLERAEDIVFDVRTDLTEFELIETISGYDALIIRSGTRVTRELLEAAPRLRVVGRAGVGVDNVDIEAATRTGVIVMNTPNANTIATAEHTLALLLATSRHIPAAHGSMVGGKWERSKYAGQELHGKTLGIIGFGRVGRLVASRAQAFGMDILAYDPYVSESIGRETKVTLANLEDVLLGSDYVTLHTSLSDETRNLMNAERIALMRDGAVLVNAARGGLVDQVAAAAALDSGKLKSIGIDVFPTEPPPSNNPLVGHPRVVHTPHLGASTIEAQRDVAIQVAEQVISALRGKQIQNSVNLAFAGDVDFDHVMPYIQLGEKLGKLQFAMAPSGIRSVEIEVHASDAEELIRPVAAGVLKGLIEGFMPKTVNYVNAPVLAEEHGIKISRSIGIGDPDYKNQVMCRVTWDGGERTVSGVVFGQAHPRIVQISGYRFEADPTGIVLMMLNADVPGVVGQVGTVLGDFGVNIAEWRLGRDRERHEALSFINLDTRPSTEAIEALRKLPAVEKAIVVEL